MTSSVFQKWLPNSFADLFSSRDPKIEYVKNPALKTIHPDFKGTPFHPKSQMFLNIDNKEAGENFWKLLRWKLIHKNQKARYKEKEDYELCLFDDDALLEDDRDFIAWLGHASFLIQINGKRILTDPCLTAPPTKDRLCDLPFAIDELRPDYYLISHGHYDHLDEETLNKFEGGTALIPLKMSGLIQDINPSIRTQEAGWFQQYQLDEPFEITFLPSYHWYRRTLTDKNKILWGSYLIKTGDKTIFFAGDTAYSPHFQSINDVFPKIDIALLPIGAYDPMFVNKKSHMSPGQALMAFEELNAQTFVPMHYGTFDLSDEPLGEPEKLLKLKSTTQNIQFLKIGEPLWLNLPTKS